MRTATLEQQFDQSRIPLGRYTRKPEQNSKCRYILFNTQVYASLLISLRNKDYNLSVKVIDKHIQTDRNYLVTSHALECVIQ